MTKTTFVECGAVVMIAEEEKLFKVEDSYLRPFNTYNISKNINTIVEVRDVSRFLWGFVEKGAHYDHDDLVMSEEYKALSDATKSNAPLSVQFDTIWFDETDIVILNSPEHALSYFYGDAQAYIYPDIQTLFVCLFKLYENIQKQKSNVVEKYISRYQKLYHCLRRIDMFVHITEEAERLEKTLRL